MSEHNNLENSNIEQGDTGQSPWRDPAGDVLREALQRREAALTPTVPPFEMVMRRIAASPSPLSQPRWGVARSMRLAGSLAWAQLRIVPSLVIPVVMVTATMATLAARFFGVSQNASAAVSGFSAVMLFGVAITVTMALSRSSEDRLALTTPLGPQVVVLARVAIVLIGDAFVGVVASAIAVSSGLSGSFALMSSGWLVPLAVVAGLVTFLAIWVSPWVGVVVATLALPFLVPPSSAGVAVGLGALMGGVREAITPIGVVALGLAMIAAAVLSARRALTATASSMLPA